MNSIQNPNFSILSDPSTFQNWTLINGQPSDIIFRTAPYSAQLNPTGSVSQTFNVVGAQTYRVLFWNTYTDMASQPYFQVTISSNVAGTTATDTFVANANTFVRYIMFFTPPIGSTTCTITFTAIGNSIIYIDDVSVTAATIVQNGGFEIFTESPPLFANWIGGFPGNPPIIHSGNQAATINPDVSLSQNGISVIPGANYQLYFYATESLPDSSLLLSITGVDPILPITMNRGPTFYELFIISFTPTTPTIDITFTYTISSPEAGSIFIDDVAIELLSTVCFSGKSMVHTKNILTNEIKDIPAYEVNSTTHLVFDSKKQIFIPLLHNAITGPIRKYVVLRKDLFGLNEPSEDFYVTSGHRIIYQDKNTKAVNIPGMKRIKIEPEFTYTFVTKESTSVLINNLHVLTHGYNEWLKYVNDKNLFWRENFV